MADSQNTLVIFVGKCLLRGNDSRPFRQLTDDVRAYVFDDGPKPHLLRQAHNIQKWGDPWGGGWSAWPFGMLDKVNTVLNLHDIMTSFKNTNTDNWDKWQKANPKAWELVIAPIVLEELEQDG